MSKVGNTIERIVSERINAKKASKSRGVKIASRDKSLQVVVIQPFTR